MGEAVVSFIYGQMLITNLRGEEMTRKDYVLIANVIQSQVKNWEGFTPEGGEAVEGLARTLANQLQADNPRFDRARFLVACGVK